MPKFKDSLFIKGMNEPNKINAKIKVMKIPKTIINPKSIIGLISLTTKDAKAATVVRAV